MAGHGLIHRYRLGIPAREEDLYNLGSGPPQHDPYTFQDVSLDGRTVLYTDGYGHTALSAWTPTYGVVPCARSSVTAN
ncbi:hypothetical protein ACIHEJ_40395 [Streptomyces sp. NPDC052301]|uniref:hypothetical protein n=1 Tax=Streptomyces sp. NPDC052301 TaxID=3365687 RepID=UPI0037D08CFE